MTTNTKRIARNIVSSSFFMGANQREVLPVYVCMSLSKLRDSEK